MTSILIVDDDEDIRSLLSEFFAKNLCAVATAKDGLEMFAVLERQQIDLVILDVMLPHEDGVSLCKRIRSTSNIPVIMLTAMTDYTDRVVGLEVGADDYVVKPFSQRELLARVKAVLRRITERPKSIQKKIAHSKLYFGKWCLDLSRRELLKEDNTLIFLTGGEFDLLLSLAEHPKRVLTRDQLLDARGLTSTSDNIPYDRSIDVLISRLRRKLEDDPKKPIIIRTVRGGGYIFEMQVISR